MSQEHCIKKEAKWKHLTYEKRLILEELVKHNRRVRRSKRLTQLKMTEMLGCSLSTIKRELKRGEVYLTASDLSEYKSYSAKIAQDLAEENGTAKGPKIKIGMNHALAEKLRELIVENKYSPYAARERLREDTDYLDTPISVKTIYNYIEKGYILDVGVEHLRRKGKQKKRRRRTVVTVRRDCFSKSISARPQEAEERSEYGHWEMDCIESGRGKGSACLLVLVERMTRLTKVFKLRSQTHIEVIRAINRIERKVGTRRFRAEFKSITVDNGSEFLNWRGIERSWYKWAKKPRTQVYFCHPYCAWERGTNEQTNGLLRIWFPKGSAITEFSLEEILTAQEWLNNYPRQVLNGLSANQLVTAFA